MALALPETQALESNQESQWVPLRIYAVKTLILEGLTLIRNAPQPDGHPTEGYSLAVLMKDTEKAHALVLHPLEPDTDGNYDLELVSENSILMWTPNDGGMPDYGAVVSFYAFELTYVPADSPEHAWEILGLDEA